MGYNPYEQGQVSQQNVYPNLEAETQNTNHFQAGAPIEIPVTQ